MIELKDIYEGQDGKCFYCGRFMSKRRSNNSDKYNGWTLDHFYSKAKFNTPAKLKVVGMLSITNRVLACLSCNRAKGSESPTKHQLRKHKKLYRAILYLS